MDKIRFGVVGLGHRGRYMARLAEDAFDCTQFVAACDVDPLLWNETQWQQDKPLKERYPEVKFYTDYAEMIAQNELDLVLVETGADVHADFCIKALDRNINVFSDIPSVASLDEARRLWDAEQNSKAKLMTGANPNEWGFVNALCDFYEKGLLGEPYYMEAEYIHPTDEWEHKLLTEHSPWRKKLAPIRYCTHSLGPLLRILKDDLREVVCFGTGMHTTAEWRNDPEYNQDDIQAALFRTDNNAVVRLLRNGEKTAVRIGYHSYRVFGTYGYFERVASRGKTPPVTRFQSLKLYGASETMMEVPIDEMNMEYRHEKAVQLHGGADYALFAHMFDAFRRGDEDFPITLRDGLRMTLPGIYAARSAELVGQKLRIRYPWDADWTPEMP